MARLTVRLTPRASRNELGPLDAVTGTVRAHVTAPPVDGRANEALTRLLAARLGVPRSAVRVVRGATARTKLIDVDGLTIEELHARLQ